MISRLSAQVDTSFTISDIIITSAPHRAQTAIQLDQIDSLHTKDAASLLSRLTLHPIKNYGPNAIATSGIRGGSSSHLKVLWNDIPLHSPMLGLTDLSLVDTYGNIKLDVIESSQAIEDGSGAVAGSLHLNTRQRDDARVDINIGSYDNLYTGISMPYSLTTHMKARTTFSNRTADNTYQYVINDTIRRNLNNAKLDQLNVKQDIFWDLGQSHGLSFHYWRTNSRREIPNTILQTRSVAYQKDRADRYALKYLHDRGLSLWKSVFGYSRQYLYYSDRHSGVSSTSDNDTWFNKTSFEYQAKHLIWTANLSNQYTTAYIKNYGAEKPKEWRTALSINIKSKSSWIPLELQCRQERINRVWTPFIFSLTHHDEYRFWDYSLALSNTYRYPSFNERFWRPGGNPNLLPEYGWEASAKVNARIAPWKVSMNTYHRRVQNWIYWGSLSSADPVSARNIASVWSSGGSLDITYTLPKWTLSYSYLLNIATNKTELTIPKIRVGSQLWYIPKHRMRTHLSYHSDRLSLGYTQTYSSSALGLSTSVSAYHLGSAHIGYTFRHLEDTITASLYIDNIWNEDYYIVEYRPMPRRTYTIGINLSF